MSDDATPHASKAAAIRRAIEDTRTTRTSLHYFSAVAELRTMATHYAEIQERLAAMKPDVYQRLIALRNKLGGGPHHDAVNEAIEILKLLEVDYV